uniref:DNA polymerase delta catalytic subunit n=1 Tax=Acrobeloides nanus TaxID=290746 RepID=A0A914CP73_9BILA
NHARSGFGLDKEVEHFVKDVQIVHGGNIYNYRPDNLQQTFLKISIVSPRLITGCRNILQQGVDLTGTGRKSLDAFEANIDFEVRFMVDTDLVGCGWVEMKAGKYKNVPDAKKCTTCQIELTINVNDVIVHPPTTPEWSDIAPLRTLSFDIECLGRKGVFPDASQDPVIQIANMVQIQGQFEPFIRNVFVLGTCAPIIGSEVIECKDEIELLQVSSIKFG